MQLDVQHRVFHLPFHVRLIFDLVGEGLNWICSGSVAPEEEKGSILFFCDDAGIARLRTAKTWAVDGNSL